MAHECTKCGMTCFCGGDIDDCCYNFSDAALNCEHCPECHNDNEDNDLEEEFEHVINTPEVV